MDQTQQAFRDYLALEKKYSMHTVNGYVKDLEFFTLFLSREYDQSNLSEVNYSQIRSWIVWMVDQGIANASVNRKISSLKAYYKFLLKAKQIEVSPLLKHKALKTPKIIQIPFSESEVDQVLTHLTFPPGFEGVRDKLIIDLFYTTGIRRAELIQLQLSAVDMYNSTLKVLGKRNKERILPMHPVLVEQINLYKTERANLEQIKDQHHFFLTTKGVKLSDSFVYRIINHYFGTISEKVKEVRIFCVTRLPHIF